MAVERRMTGCHAGAELEREKLATDLRELENSVKHLVRMGPNIRTLVVVI